MGHAYTLTKHFQLVFQLMIMHCIDAIIQLLRAGEPKWSLIRNAHSRYMHSTAFIIERKLHHVIDSESHERGLYLALTKKLNKKMWAKCAMAICPQTKCL